MYIATAYVHAANKKQHDCVSSLEKLWQNPVFNSADNESETPENTEQNSCWGSFLFMVYVLNLTFECTINIQQEVC